MAAQQIISLILICAIASAAFWRRRRQASVKRRREADDGSLWIGLAAGLFDTSDSPPAARLEVALAAIAKRLQLRGGMVVHLEGESCRVIAASGPAEGIVAGETLPKGETYFGSVGADSTLTIDYASLSEWRRHDACRVRGWEAFVGFHCGDLGQGRIVAGFFDSVPREQLFLRAELQLLEQMAPWLGALAGHAAEAIAKGGPCSYMNPGNEEAQVDAP